MSLKKSLVVCLLSLILASDAQHQDIEDISETLDELLVDARSFRRPRDREDKSLIWHKYEFGSGAGNREEVVVTNISLHTNTDIPEKSDWQFLRAGNDYFIRAEDSALLFYEINLDELSVEPSINVTTEGRILLFRVFDYNVDETEREDRAGYSIAILFVESTHGYFLFWYRISEGTIQLCSKLSMQHEFQDMEVVREGSQNELLLLDDNTYLEQSLILVYGFNYDHSNHSIDIWFCRRLYVPKTFDVQVCPIYGGTVLAFRTNDSVVLYASQNEDALCKYEEFEVIETNELANFVCFESGHIEYLVIAGKEAHLFHFLENEFHDNGEADLAFSGITGISWITAVPLNTYRDESLLLAQLENSTVIALAWQGSNFKQVPLPNQIMNDFNLSRVVVVPKVGFMHGNTLVRVDVILREVAHPIHRETDSILKTRVLLEDVFRVQEDIFDKTEEKMNQSYLKNPVTGFWSFTRMDVSNVTIGEDVKYSAIKVGTMDLQLQDVLTNVTSSLKKLEKLEVMLDQVLSILEQVDNVYTMKIVLPPDAELNGNFLVNGTLRAKNTSFVNKAPTSSAAYNNASGIADFINGRKSFPTIDTDNLTVITLNGVPLEEYIFDTSIKSYDDMDFSRSKRLEINGYLNFSEINDVDWGKLMQNIVWKNETRIIPGHTIMNGQIIVDAGTVERLNDLQYPRDFVPRHSWSPVNVTGEKFFSTLSAMNLINVSKINDVDIDDFIIVSRHEVLDREITFENLQIDGVFQVDGNITGINAPNLEDSLNETNTLNTDVIFENLIVMGNIVLRDSIDAKTWSDFDDLLLKNETNATITGNKKFLSGVTLKSMIRVTQINGHALSEFVHLDADQQFPNLKRISANVTFGNVSLGAMNKLEDYIINEQNVSSGCMEKILLFMKPPIVDEISFKTIGLTITAETFFDKLNESFRRVYFENLTLSTLKTDEITPNTINGMWNYTDLAKHVLTISTRQSLTGSLVVNNLEIGVLDAKLVNGVPIRDLNRLLTHAGFLYDRVVGGNETLQSLQVTGQLSVSSINGRNILDIYDPRSMKPVIFRGNVTIDNLTVLGFVNGRNLSEFVDDAVRKTDRNVTFTGNKTLGNVTCEFLNVQFVNGHFVDDILDPDRQQELKKPVYVKGSITVLNSFNATGKIGNMFFRDFTDRFKPLGNNSYALRGDFHFTENVSIARLDGPIQGSLFDNFLQRAIVKNDSNVTISGAKLFSKPITFYDEFTIDSSLDDLDLLRFREKAVYIDEPFSIDSRVVFKEDVHIRRNLVAKKTLEASTIMGVDMKDLRENAILLNAPVSFEERMTLDNVTFQASVKVTQVNDLRMDELIPLHTDQFILQDVHSFNITYRNIHWQGRVNNYILNDIYTDTFTIHEDQNITGTIKIRGNVYAYSDFDVYTINHFKVNQIVFVNTNETLIGNFAFGGSVILDKSLRILGTLNDIDLAHWQGTAVMKKGEKQTIFGQWRVHGNVTFEKNVNGTEILSGVNITEALAILAKERVQINAIIEETDEKLNSVCKSLNVLKCNSADQIYKFDTFDYVKVVVFEGDIHNIRIIDSDNLGYLLVNHDNCSMTLLQYTSAGFAIVDQVSDVGLIDRWVFYTMNRKMYILTIATHACGKHLNNIWRLENNKLMHVMELGNVTNYFRTFENTYIKMIHDDHETVPESDLQLNILKALVSLEEERSNSNLYNDSITSVNQSYIHELQSRSLTGISLRDCLNCSNLLSFRVGIFEREEYVYYNAEISQNHIYIWRNDASQTKILQIINAHRPKSILILNFDGFVETLLIFIENNETIQIYEYRGIEGFVYRNSIKMKADQLYKFRMRKYTYMKKRHYLAAVSGNRLTILEAKMHGERLDWTTLTSTDSCSMIACPRH
ncbi:uncharacterized protein LOC116850535 [Odontomachus brunneus]|uniref:uncharacterized protein LOC116850535 n=1 Tax=Odontomachus brunneus TaxID=486640 RepID=UPI0013F20D00|nr:uncharacterized protein LOC116850535 [Odontomachus brunneus]